MRFVRKHTAARAKNVPRCLDVRFVREKFSKPRADVVIDNIGGWGDLELTRSSK